MSDQAIPFNKEPAKILQSADEVARALSIAKSTLFRLVREGKLPKPLKIGTLTRWQTSTIQLYIESLASMPRQFARHVESASSGN